MSVYIIGREISVSQMEPYCCSCTWFKRDLFEALKQLWWLVTFFWELNVKLNDLFACDISRVSDIDGNISTIDPNVISVIIKSCIREAMSKRIGRVNVMEVIPSVSKKRFLSVMTFKVDTWELVFSHSLLVLRIWDCHWQFAAWHGDSLD